MTAKDSPTTGVVLAVMAGLLVGAITGAVVVYREVGEIHSTLQQVVKNQEDNRQETIRFRTEIRDDMNQIGRRVLDLERQRNRRLPPPDGVQ